MKFPIAFIFVLAMASLAGSTANAACPPDHPTCQVADNQLGPASAIPPAPAPDPASDMLNGQITAHNDAIEAQNQAAQANYRTQLATYEAEKTSQETIYKAQLAEHDAKVAADLAAWQASVAACKAGDTTQCSH
jgi:hypothetical protein